MAALLAASGIGKPPVTQEATHKGWAPVRKKTIDAAGTLVPGEKDIGPFHS